MMTHVLLHPLLENNDGERNIVFATGVYLVARPFFTDTFTYTPQQCLAEKALSPEQCLMYSPSIPHPITFRPCAFWISISQGSFALWG